jgi:2-amino-4-hydroxy-6-hydroxymethyldihydropteridine diphosphokinase
VKPIFLSLGSNIGNKILNLNTASENIEKYAGKICSKSSIYETSAWGIIEQDTFLNQVIEIETNLKPSELIAILLKIEEQMGRKREIKWGPRLIDIDILYFSDKIIEQNSLIVPHPYLHQRRFILMPLCEIAPDFEHPILKKTTKELLKNCDDKGQVVKM